MKTVFSQYYAHATIKRGVEMGIAHFHSKNRKMGIWNFWGFWGLAKVACQFMRFKLLVLSYISEFWGRGGPGYGHNLFKLEILTISYISWDVFRVLLFHQQSVIGLRECFYAFNAFQKLISQIFKGSFKLNVFFSFSPRFMQHPNLRCKIHGIWCISSLWDAKKCINVM